MNRIVKFSFRRIIISHFLIFLSVVLSGLLILSLIKDERAENIIYLIVFFLSFLLILNIVCTVRKQLLSFTDIVLDAMDELEKGNELSRELEMEDTLYAKILTKIYRVSKINQLKSERYKKESEIIHELVSNISHQVKTPIANIKIYNQLLIARAEEQSDTMQFLKIMEEQVNKLDFLMHTLIKMSRLETNIIALKPIRNSVLNMLASAISDVMFSAEVKKIKIITECRPDIIGIFDNKWTTEAVFNILDNAVKYSKVETTVSINVSNNMEYVEIEIIDMGPGIKEQMIPLLFKRFYRSEELSQKEEGLGVGLNLAQEIIIRQKGYISVESVFGKGSNFIIHLQKP